MRFVFAIKMISRLVLANLGSLKVSPTTSNKTRNSRHRTDKKPSSRSSRASSASLTDEEDVRVYRLIYWLKLITIDDR